MARCTVGGPWSESSNRQQVFTAKQSAPYRYAPVGSLVAAHRQGPAGTRCCSADDGLLLVQHPCAARVVQILRPRPTARPRAATGLAPFTARSSWLRNRRCTVQAGREAKGQSHATGSNDGLHQEYRSPARTGPIDTRSCTQ